MIRFFKRLPNPSPEKQIEPERPLMEDRRRMRILFVDSDEDLKSFCSEVLTFAGYSVELASSGTEAYWKLKESSFDLVITDIKLKGMDGLGLYLDTLKIYSHMREKFLFMTEDSCADFESQALITRQNEKYLLKPFDIKELLKKVEALTGANLSAFFAKYSGPDENRRADRRLCWAEDCKVFEDGSEEPRPFTQTADVSKHGVRIRYMGTPLRAEDVVHLFVKWISIESGALVVWSREINGMEAASGLRLFEPVTAASLSKVLQDRKTFIPPLVSSEEGN